jgi:hypothetical protein
MNPEDLGKYYESILDKEVRKKGKILLLNSTKISVAGILC